MDEINPVQHILDNFISKAGFLLVALRCHKTTHSISSTTVFFTSTFMKSSIFCLYRCRILNNWKTTTLRLQVCRCLKTISKTADVRAAAGGEEKSRDKMSVCSIFVQFFYQYLMTNSWWCCYYHPHSLSFFKYLKQLSLLMKASLFWGGELH